MYLYGDGSTAAELIADGIGFELTQYDVMQRPADAADGDTLAFAGEREQRDGLWCPSEAQGDRLFFF